LKLTKTVYLLARPTGFEPVTLGLEMRGIEVRIVSSCLVLLFCNNHFTRCLRKWLKDSLTYPSKL